jgi:hypothetical protein
MVALVEAGPVGSLRQNRELGVTKKEARSSGDG